MLEKPDLDEQHLVATLEAAYGIQLQSVTFLPLGADLNTAVYRAVTIEDTPYFIKLRRGGFNAASVTVPRYLSNQGLEAVIPPLPTTSGAVWSTLPPFTLVLYPYIEGQNGFEREVSDVQRRHLGVALRQLHGTRFPEALTEGLEQEQFSAHWRDVATSFLNQIEHDQRRFVEPVAWEMATFLAQKSDLIRSVIRRTAQLAQEMSRAEAEFVVCHADIHGWNLLIDKQEKLYIVDWDTLMLAPKERDLMFVGSGLGGRGHSLAEEERLFYEGYGGTAVDPLGLVYYRYERSIEDIAAFCEEIFLTEEGGADRPQALIHLKSIFNPGGVLDIARAADSKLAS